MLFRSGLNPGIIPSKSAQRRREQLPPGGRGRPGPAGAAGASPGPAGWLRRKRAGDPGGPGVPLPPGRQTRGGSQAGDWLGKRCGVPATAPRALGREGRSGLAPRVPSPVSRPEGGREERAQREGPRSRVGKPAPRSAPGCLAAPSSVARDRGKPGEGSPGEGGRRGGRGRAKGGPVRRAGTDWTRRGWLPRGPAAGSGKASWPTEPRGGGLRGGPRPTHSGHSVLQLRTVAVAARVLELRPAVGFEGKGGFAQAPLNNSRGAPPSAAARRPAELPACLPST